MTNHGKPWTAANCSRLRILINSGVPFRRAAVILGRSEYACRRVFWAFRINSLSFDTDVAATLRSKSNESKKVLASIPNSGVSVHSYV